MPLQRNSLILTGRMKTSYLPVRDNILDKLTAFRDKIVIKRICGGIRHSDIRLMIFTAIPTSAVTMTMTMSVTSASTASFVFLPVPVLLKLTGSIHSLA